jgi:hypothetical protein
MGRVDAHCREADVDLGRAFGNRLAYNSNVWTFAIEHIGTHNGQLVVYYPANNLVPPDSRHECGKESMKVQGRNS